MPRAPKQPAKPSPIPDSLRPLAWPLAKLKLDPRNARGHDDRNIEAVRRSLEKFGWRGVVVARKKDGIVLAGNARVQAALQLGWTDAPVLFVEDDAKFGSAYAITDNRTAELATWKMEELVRQLHELSDDDDLMDVIGFTDDEVADLFANSEDDAKREVDDPGPESPPAVCTSQAGDLWLLGDHRLLCGDSTAAKDVRRVMGDEKAALVATDPPYLVDYTGERPNDTGKDWSDTYREIDITDADGFFRAVFTNVLAVLALRGAIYCWHAHKRCGDIQRIWRDLGILDHQQIIWVKPTPVFGRVYWHFRHEPCVMGWRQGDKPEHDGVHDHDSVWEVDWDGKARVVGNEHPTEKPVELFIRPMKKHTKPGDVVFEPFSGSGSQLIAAERTGRRCRAIEISPAFVDVAIRRWQKATGKAATLDGDGRTYDQLTNAPRQAPAGAPKSKKSKTAT